MAKQDDFVRITLRIPQDLYEQVRVAADTKSINAEILDRLAASFDGVTISPATARTLAKHLAEYLKKSDAQE